MERPQKDGPPPDMPSDFLKNRATRKARVEFLLRKRINEGPRGLFNSHAHQPLYAPVDVFLALLKFQKKLIEAGFSATLSSTEVKFMHGMMSRGKDAK